MTHSFPALEPCEKIVPSSDELLYRQITKHYFNEVEKVPSVLAFGPASIDKGKPSFARDSHPDVDAQTSRDWHQQNATSPSLGVWALAADEVVGTSLRTVDDGDCPVEPDEKKSPGHCYVDYRGLTDKERRRIRSELFLLATDRGELPTVDNGHHLSVG